MTKTWISAIVAFSVLASAGCQSGNKQASSSQGQANSNSSSNPMKPSPEDIKFETSRDPPIKAQTRFAAGQLAESREDYNRAIDQYWDAVKLDPKYKEAYFRLGVLYCKLQHYPDATVAWKQYIKYTGGNATGYSNLGCCYELAGNHQEAEAAFRKGIDKDPKNNPCRVNYGLMLAKDNRINEAIVQLQTVLTPAEVHYNLASVYEHQGRKEQARVEYRKAIDIDPNMADAEVKLSSLR